MEDVLVPVFVVGMLFIGLPWLVLHYVTRWKTAATLTNDDERMLGDMHELARRLEDRLDTVERLVAQDNPEWQPRRLDHEAEIYAPENVRSLERNR
nr:envelope stress response membrane protein PspB [uncultured Sphingorhabdus sp.]